ncbi:MAG: mechanosensitive ion channel family protein [Methanocellales archaeon]|nr:mechanosensitive ion channel family protein [Methanocellales archaeon]
MVDKMAGVLEEAISSLLASYMVPLLIIISFVVFGYVLVLIIDRYIARLAEKTRTKLDDIIVRTVRMPLIFIFVVIGVGTVLHYMALPPEIEVYVDPLLLVFIVLAAVFCVSRILMGFIKHYAKKHEGTKPVAPIIQRVVQVVIYLIGLMIIFDVLGVSITPLLTTLGIGGVAVALALQETLSNFFSGFYIMTDRPVRVGDYIKLDSGEEGYVVDVGWRTSRIRSLPNNVIVIPNKRLTQAIVTNYYLPEKEMSCLVDVGVSYDSDLEKVEKVTIDVAKKVLKKVSGGVETFEPFIRYNKFGDFSINFTVILRVREYVDKYLVTHEFMKELHKRYNKEGIVIPFPIRTVYMKGQKES